ncbi:MAG: aminoacyl-tRNA hydrolase, partial [Reyranellaceae bacterium]
MLLLVGLGNPGARYAGTRHNIGFMAADLIVRRHGFSPWRKRFQGEAAEGSLDAVRTLALKPQTFMNESGRAVGEAMKFYKLTPEDVVVLYDEIDLAPGKIKVKKGGGAAGHNGIRSIDAHIGPDFWRVR